MQAARAVGLSLFSVCLWIGCAAPRAKGAPQSSGDRIERDPSTITPAEMAEIQARMMDAGLPGAEHARLAKYAGEWNLETTVAMGPGAEPMTMQSHATAEMVLGGRFLMTRGRSEFMGQPTESLSLLGFDRRSNEFTLVAFDSTGTYSVSGRGPLGADGKTAVMSGTDYDAIGQLTQIYDFVMTMVDDDTLKFEIVFHDKFHAPTGEPFRMVEVVNRRAK